MTVTALVAGIISLFLGSISYELFQRIRHRTSGKEAPPKTYSERLSELTSSLTSASAQVDSILRELSSVAKEKETAIKKLESNLTQLEKQEQERKQTIEALQNVSLPVAAQFAKLVEPSERRSAKRDYILFGAGLIVSAVLTTVITLIIQAVTK